MQQQQSMSRVSGGWKSAVRVSAGPCSPDGSGGRGEAFLASSGFWWLRASDPRRSVACRVIAAVFACIGPWPCSASVSSWSPLGRVCLRVQCVLSLRTPVTLDEGSS